jgi:hypothetical protein
VSIQLLSNNSFNGKLDQKVVEKELNTNQLFMVTSNFLDRLIATYTLIHLENSVLVLSETRRILKDGAVASIYLPSKPVQKFRFFKCWTTARKRRHFGATQLFSHYNQDRFQVLYLHAVSRDVFESEKATLAKHPFEFLIKFYALAYISNSNQQKRGLEFRLSARAVPHIILFDHEILFGNCPSV